MRNAPNPGGEAPSPITVQTAHGLAEFERTDPTSAKLVLDYEVDILQAEIPNGSEEGPQQAIEEACRQEVDECGHRCTRCAMHSPNS